MQEVLEQVKSRPLLRPVSPPVLEEEVDFGVLASGSLFKLTRLRGVSVRAALIYCHGFRPVQIPLTAPLCASDNPHGPVYRRLMAQGFVVASVSYRRSGHIYNDAVDDVVEMRELLVARFNPERFLVQGRSMGGAVGTLCNERAGHLFDGIICLGAALHVNHHMEKDVKFTHRPKSRMIFCTNISELAVVASYISKCPDDEHKPVLLELNRPGHCAIFSEELSNAFEMMLRWIETDEAPAARSDLTNYALEPQIGLGDTGALWDEGRRGFWSPLSVTMYWNLQFPFTQSQWDRVHVKPRRTFKVEIHREGQEMEEVEFFFSVDPFVGVAAGTKIAFLTPMGSYSVLKTHYTGTHKDTIATELGIRREGDWIFVPESIPEKRKRVKRIQ